MRKRITRMGTLVYSTNEKKNSLITVGRETKVKTIKSTKSESSDNLVKKTVNSYYVMVFGKKHTIDKESYDRLKDAGIKVYAETE